MRQIRVTQYGGPEQMRLVELPDPAPGEALVRVTVAGVNYMDIAARSMPLPG
jgi:NADPH:quinone reductase